MRITRAALLAVTLFSLGACEVPGAPKWDIDLYFPIKYPDIPLSTFAVGGTILPGNIAFTTPVDSSDISDATLEILDQELTALTAEVIFSNQTNVAGNLEISMSPNRAFLFSSNPAQAVTFNINPLHITPAAGDTTRITVLRTLFNNASKIYTQSRGNIRSGTGAPLPVSASNRFTLGVDLTATIPFSKRETP